MNQSHDQYNNFEYYGHNRDFVTRRASGLAAIASPLNFKESQNLNFRRLIPTYWLQAWQRLGPLLLCHPFPRLGYLRLRPQVRTRARYILTPTFTFPAMKTRTGPSTPPTSVQPP